MSKLFSLLLLIGGLYLIWLLMLFFMQRSMMYPGAHMALPQLDPPDDVTVWQINAHGEAVEAWWMPPEQPPLAVAIYAHGNGELIDYAPQDVGQLRTLGIAVLAVEYPGYGRSAGSPTQHGITEVFCAAWDRLRSEPGLESVPVIGYGRSLGGGAIGQLATCHELDAIILESTFASARSFARRYLAPGALMRDPFDTTSVLQHYRGPVLITHGRDDRIVPYAHSEQLLAAAPHAQRITLECGHNDCPPDWLAYLRHIGEFLRSAGILPSQSQPAQS